MLFKIRLKTGFFETKAYDLMVGKDKLVLSPEESESDTITIPEKNIGSITLNNQKNPEIEIQTRDKIYKCGLIGNSDFEKLVNSIKENLSVKIICEYEGGKAYE